MTCLSGNNPSRSSEGFMRVFELHAVQRRGRDLGCAGFEHPDRTYQPIEVELSLILGDAGPVRSDHGIRAAAYLVVHKFEQQFFYKK